MSKAIASFLSTIIFITGVFIMNSSTAADKYKWETAFDGATLPSTIWHVGDLWWYGLAEVFYNDCEIDYRKEDATTFWIEGKGNGPKGFFGVKFPWCSKEFMGSAYSKPSYYLQSGYIYRFIIGMDEKPDCVLINKKIVWEKNSGKYENRYVEFTYVPEKEKEEIDIYILDTVEKNIECKLILTRSPYYERPKMRCFRAAYDSNKTVSYEMFDFSSSTRYAQIDKEIASRRLEKYNSTAVDYVFNEFQDVPYETSRIKFICNSNEGTQEKGDYFLDYAEKSKFDIFDLDQKRISAKLIDNVKSAGMDVMLYPSIKAGKDTYTSEHWIRFLERGKLAEAQSGTKNLIKECLAINPDFNIYLMYPEFSSIFGHWAGGIENSPMKTLPGMNDVIAKGGADAYNAICDYWRGVTKEIKDSAPRGKVKIVVLYSGGIHGALLAKLGADVLMNKHIHRRSQNIVVANARGPANAYDLEYGFDDDCWNRCYVCDYHPDEVRQNLMVYYFSGGKYIYPEMLTVANDKNALTAVGREWLEFIRYCKYHPALGQQKVKIAIIRGLPDEWNRFAAPSTSWEAAKDGNEVTYRKYFEDYNLLNLVFPDYGLFYRTFSDRLCTGTPYGPVDFVPWDIPADKLKQYEIVVYLGKSECMTSEIYKNLKNYVASGGTLFAALGQFKDKDGKLLKKDFRDFLGVESMGDFTLKEDPAWDRENSKAWTLPSGKVKYPLIKASGKNSRVVYRFKNSDPYVTENSIGKGKVYLFASDYLTQIDTFTPGRLIQPELEKTKWLSFTPSSDWLEYMVQKKGSICILPFFNHGNVGFPSGNGRKTGPWNGNVTLDLSKFEFPEGKLAVYESVYVPDEKVPYKLVKIDSVHENDRLSFNIKIDKFSEIVIGPHGNIESEYFSKRSEGKR